MRGVKRRFTHTRAVSCVCTVYVSFFLTLTTPTDGSRHSPERHSPPHSSHAHVDVTCVCLRPQAAPAPLRAPRTEAARCPSSSPTCRPSQMLSLRAHYRVQVRTVVFSGSPALGEWPPAASLRSHAISIVSSSRAHGQASRVGLDAFLASLCVRLRAVRRHGEPRQQHLLA